MMLNRIKRKAQFSMVEIMVSISIIVILLGILTTALGDGVDGGKILQTKGEISKMEMALNQYLQNNGSYPSYTGSIKDLPVLGELQNLEDFETIDAWGNEIRYVSHQEYSGNALLVAQKTVIGPDIIFYNHRFFQLISPGEDGEFGDYFADSGLTDEARDNICNFEIKE
jgi:type II secretory pathway pseudopilin PulG